MSKKIIAIDTEFERKKTYKPILSIVQVKEEGKEPVIYDIYEQKKDSLKYLTNLLSDEGVLKIIHAARQDVEAIYYHFNIVMKNIFDTQIAVNCLTGENEIGYAKLIKQYCKKDIVKEKKLQKSHWLHRPLTDEQIFYAKQDVEYLHEAYYILNKLMSEKSNTQRNADIKSDENIYEQFKKKCSLLEDKRTYAFNPKHTWQKLQIKYKKNKKCNLIRDMVILREKIAFSIDVPREFVLSTKNLVSFAETGDVGFLKTNYKVDKNEFLKLLNNTGKR